MFCVADQPMLTRQTIVRLCGTFLSDTTKIVTLSWNGKRGNPVIFPKALFSELLSLRKARPAGQSSKDTPKL